MRAFRGRCIFHFRMMISVFCGNSHARPPPRHAERGNAGEFLGACGSIIALLNYSRADKKIGIRVTDLPRCQVGQLHIYTSYIYIYIRRDRRHRVIEARARMSLRFLLPSGKLPFHVVIRAIASFRPRRTTGGNYARERILPVVRVSCAHKKIIFRAN